MYSGSAMSGRSGTGVLLLALKLGFQNPFSRVVLKALTKEIEYKGVRRRILEESLRHLAGDGDVCMLARFYSLVLRTIIETGMMVFHGDRKEAWKNIRDPSIRKGFALIIEGLARYGVTVPQRLPTPFLIVWNFTNMCNLRCRHCYQRAEKPLPNELSLEEKLRIVRELDEAGVAALAFSGGEPTIHPHFLRVLSEASRRGLYTSVATNGWTLADPNYARKLKKAGLRYVEVSIDSADPRKHDKFRGLEGSWRRAVEGLKTAVKMGFSTGMATTVTRLNFSEIDELLDLAEEIGVQRVIFFNFIPVGRGRDIANLDLDPIEREKLLRKLYHENQKRKIDIFSTAPQFGRVSFQLSGGRDVAATHFYLKGDPVISTLAEFIGGCGAGRIYAAIQPDGVVTPCVFMPIPVGDLRKERFREIWENSPLLKRLRERDRFKENCGKCPYRFICGGCRARAYSYLGDPTGPDPGCIYNLRVLAEDLKHLPKSVVESMDLAKLPH